MIILFLFAPLIFALIALLIPANIFYRYKLSIVFLSFVLEGYSLVQICFDFYLSGGVISYFNDLIYIDSFSIVMIVLVVFIGMLSLLYSLYYIEEDNWILNIPTFKTKQFFLLLYMFIGMMELTVSTGNIGGMWVTIEATTIISAVLIAFYRHNDANEAAWRYFIICGTGITLALFGSILLYYASYKAFGEIAVNLNWTFLHINARGLNPTIVELAFLFIIVGYGTKMGIAPMHGWLPEAHAEAPTPVSALLSAVLCSVAAYLIIRIGAIVNIASGASFSSAIFIFFGLLSILVASISLFMQKNPKRMLAFSTVEHMGIILIGVAIGTYWALFGSILHIITHGVAKTLAFKSTMGYKSIYKFPTLNKIALLGAAGIPFFGLFISEFIIIREAFIYNSVIGVFVLAGIVISGLAIILSITRFAESHVSSEPQKEYIPVSYKVIAFGVLAALFSVSLVLGVFIPAYLVQFIDASIRILL